MLRTSGRLVASPSLEACKNRPKHYMDKRTGHYYFYSGKSHHGALKVRVFDPIISNYMSLRYLFSGWLAGRPKYLSEHVHGSHFY